MNMDDRIVNHLAGRLGCDAGAFKQKKPLFIASAERDHPDWTGRSAPLWILARGRTTIVSIVPPLASMMKNHHLERLATAGEGLPADVASAIAHDLVPFYGRTEAVHRTWFAALEGFEHVQEIEIVPLRPGDAAELDDFAPGWWPRLRDLAAAGRVDAVRLDGRAVAFAAPFAESRFGAEIGCLTHPDYRGIGLGRELVAAVSSRLLGERRTPLFTTSHASPSAGRIAKTLGFSEVAQDWVFAPPSGG